MNYVLLAVQLMPYILQAIQAVESAMPNSTGANKKSVVMSSVQAVSSTPGVTVPTDHVVNLISNLVDITVGALNTTGVLQHSPSSVSSQTH